MKRLQRLERLERSAAAVRVLSAEQTRKDEEATSRLEAAWTIMSQTMNEEHAQLVVDAYAFWHRHKDDPRISAE